jgi:hypothetical protein
MILSLTSFFAVAKGATDIRMVYNGTSSGMNSHLWAPWFYLPTICALLRALKVNTYMADSDIGEIVKLLPLPQPPLRARTDARTNPSAQRATQLRSVLARVYAVARQNQITTSVS